MTKITKFLPIRYSSLKFSYFAKRDELPYYSDPNENCSPMLAFSFMTNLRQNNNFPIVRKVITLDFTEASILDSVQTMILKNCKTQFSCILANLVDICLKEPCFTGF